MLRKTLRKTPARRPAPRALCGLAAAMLLLSASCGDRFNKELPPVAVEIEDPIRHYYPVVQGEVLNVSYEFENTSDDPLFIKEVQTTCGCLIPRDDLPLVILPHRKGYLRLGFNSIKNSGYVEHFVWCYGNFTDSMYRELQFTTNVVPDADYLHDYEELWHNQEEEPGQLRDWVDGKASEKGYYTDADTLDNREDHKNEIQRQADALAL